MYYYLSGTVAHIEPFLAVIDCGGVGYACRTTSFTLSRIKTGEKAKLYTYLSVREDAMDLYGFSSQEERRLFQLLTSVSGVGPKAALAILSSSTPENLALSIITGDEKALTAAQGVGKKIAQRVILELKDKLAKGQSISAAGENIAYFFQTRNSLERRGGVRGRKQRGLSGPVSTSLSKESRQPRPSRAKIPPL